MKRISKQKILILVILDVLLVATVLLVRFFQSEREERMYSQQAGARWESGDVKCAQVSAFFADSKAMKVENMTSIHNDIMKKLFGEYSGARKMVFMVEDEAIARIDCGPNTKQYGPLAILCSLYGKYTYEFKVPHTAFVPQPRTTSAVISFSRTESADILSSEFVKFLTACFSMRRKMLKKNLASFKSPDLVNEALEKTGISENARAEELRPDEFASLFTQLRSSTVIPGSHR